MAAYFNQNSVAITAVSGGYEIKSPFNPSFIEALKTKVPSYARSFDKSNKTWTVEPEFIQPVADLLNQHYRTIVVVPEPNKAVVKICETLRIEYIGACKITGRGYEANAFCNGQWSVVFPEDVLRPWFESGQSGLPDTLYSLLGVTQEADAKTIKSKYRQLARQWHPDVCKEEGARERFERYQQAYELLSDETARRKYDVGLMFSSRAKERPVLKAWQKGESGYRSPLRCGLVTVEANLVGNRKRVTKILQWDDIVNADGLVMVTSWPFGAKMFQIDWVAY